MMIDPPIGELLEKVDCRYTLAVEASKRARELIGGSLPLIRDPRDEAADHRHRGNQPRPYHLHPRPADRP